MWTWLKSLFARWKKEAVETADEWKEEIEEVKQEVAEVIEDVADNFVDYVKMTKTELDIYARDLGLRLDKRKTKDNMIKEIQNHLNKEN